MHDDELRQELDSLLRPIREVAPPDPSVIRRRLIRLRRRRVRLGGLSAAATAAAVVAGVIAVHTGAGAAGPAAGASPATASPTVVAATSSGPTRIGNGYQSAASYTVSSAVTSLVVTGDVGGISVTGSQRATTSVSAVLYYTTAPPTLTRTLRGTTLTLGYSCPSNDSCGVSFGIQVPRTTTVRASESTGGIGLTGLAGDITATDQVGAINAMKLTSGTVSLHTSTGGIRASFLTPPASLHATSNLGAVAIGLPGGASYRVNASTGVGATRVSVPVDPSSEYSINASTGTGGVLIVTGDVGQAQGS
jgi:hypothetical protein